MHVVRLNFGLQFPTLSLEGSAVWKSPTQWALPVRPGCRETGILTSVYSMRDADMKVVIVLTL